MQAHFKSSASLQYNCSWKNLRNVVHRNVFHVTFDVYELTYFRDPQIFVVVTMQSRYNGDKE